MIDNKASILIITWALKRKEEVSLSSMPQRNKVDTTFM